MADLTVVPAICVPSHEEEPSAQMAGQNKKPWVLASYKLIGPKDSPPDPSQLEAGLNSETGFKSIYYRTVIYIYISKVKIV